MKRLEAILSRDSLAMVTGLLMEHGCGEISLFKVDGKDSQLTAPCTPGEDAEFPWVRLEAVVGDAEAVPTVQAILHASHGTDHGDSEETERINSIAIWKLESRPPRSEMHRV